MKDMLRFITWPAIAGLLAALLILDRWVFTPDSNGFSHGPVSYAPAVARASPSVVNIYTQKVVPDRRSPLLEDRFLRRIVPPQARRPRIESALGSGVIMTRQGHVLTNNHVIAGADAIWVLLHDGRTAGATVVGTDPATDLAVLHVDLPDMQPMEPGASDQARVGDVVLAIGNPLGLGHSVTQGIISALGRYGLQLSAYEDYIQTDATIHQGNSGGALVDARGRLLGINTLIYTGDQAGRSTGTGIGISLAIPVDLAVFVMQDLIEYGEVIRGWLGVSVDPTTITDPAGQALVVAAVSANSPAGRAGIMQGDIITHIDGEPVRDGRLTMHRIAMLRPGERIDITVLRDRQSLELQAVVGTLRQSGVPLR